MKISTRSVTERLTKLFGELKWTYPKTRFGHESRINVRIRNCPINFIEHVRVTVKISHPVRGELDISIKSPQGTNSVLLERRFKDKV